MSKPTVAILGLGLMGGGMAATLLARGFETVVWNRSPAKAAALGAQGARVAATPAEAARGATHVLAMLADDDASRGVWMGENGALAAMQRDAVAIESGTLTVGWIRQLAIEAVARGVAFIDAPVTGSRQQAAAGQLRFIVGGEAAALDQARPVLEAMGSEVVHVGPVGSGALTKIINNFLCGVQVASLGEAIAMAEKAGLDAEATASILTQGAPGSPLVKALTQRMLARDYTPNFLLTLMAKDMAYAIETFAAAGVTLASAQAARARFLAAAEQVGDKDIAAVIEPLRHA